MFFYFLANFCDRTKFKKYKQEEKQSHCSTFNDMNTMKTKKRIFKREEEEDILGICDDNENLRGRRGKVSLFLILLFCNVYLLLKHTCSPFSNPSIV